jgi:uncharacterized protein (TIGR02266 family)
MASHPDDVKTRESDKRHFKRVYLSAVVDLKTKASCYSGYTENISEGGVFISTPTPLPIGEPLDLNLTLTSGETVVLRARVAWHRPFREDGPPSGMGLQFVFVPEAIRNDIRNFVETGIFDVLLWRTE